MQENKLQDRREFLRSAGKVLAGAAALSAVSPLLGAYDHAVAEEAVEAPAYPFTYQKLDPDATLERGYQSFYDLGGCAAGAFDAIIGQLAESDNRIIGTVFRHLQRRLREENGLSLGYLWRASLRDCRDQVGLGQPECEILSEAAAWLGRYDAEEQVAGLEQIARRLAAARDTAAGELQNKGNLYRTCGIALGILVVLVLI